MYQPPFSRLVASSQVNREFRCECPKKKKKSGLKEIYITGTIRLGGFRPVLPICSVRITWEREVGAIN